MRNWPWSVLAIDPTNDVSAVRSGYATILRSFEPDDDPDRYAALRQARDYALMVARAGEALVDTTDEDDDEDWDDLDWDSVEDAPAGIQTYAGNTYVPPIPDEQPEGQQTVIDGHYAALSELLRPQENSAYPPSPEEADAMWRHFAALLADRRMDNITFRADADDHFLYLLADCVPRSDPLLAMAAGHFGWYQRRGRIGQPPILDWLLDHADEVSARSPTFEAETAHFRAELENPSSQHYRIWQDLTGDGGENDPAPGLPAKRVMALLQNIRQYYHPLLNAVNPARIAYWQRAATKAEKRKNRLIMAGAFAFMVLALSLNHFFPDTPPSPRAAIGNPLTMPANEKISTPERDIGRALQLVGNGVPVAVVQSKNPNLYTVLLGKWMFASEHDTPAIDFANDTGRFLRGLFAGNLAHAPRALLTDYWRLEIARTRLVERFGGDACARYVTRTLDPPPLAGPEAGQMRSLEGRLLTEVRYVPSKAPSDRSYRIPGEIVVRAANRAGLPIETFGKALRGKAAAPGASCDARIALIETVIATPGPIGDGLLRKM